MDTKHLEENFVSLLNDINMQRPKREGAFITRYSYIQIVHLFNSIQF